MALWHGILGRSTQIIHKTFHPKHVSGLRQIILQLGGFFPAQPWPGTHRALNDVEISATFEMWKWVEDAPQTELRLFGVEIMWSFHGVETSILWRKDLKKKKVSLSSCLWFLQFSPEIIPEIDFRVY